MMKARVVMLDNRWICRFSFTPDENLTNAALQQEAERVTRSGGT